MSSNCYQLSANAIRDSRVVIRFSLFVLRGRGVAATVGQCYIPAKMKEGKK